MAPGAMAEWKISQVALVAYVIFGSFLDKARAPPSRHLEFAQLSVIQGQSALWNCGTGSYGLPHLVGCPHSGGAQVPLCLKLDGRRKSAGGLGRSLVHGAFA